MVTHLQVVHSHEHGPEGKHRVRLGSGVRGEKVLEVESCDNEERVPEHEHLCIQSLPLARRHKAHGAEEETHSACTASTEKERRGREGQQGQHTLCLVE